jgi:hypothetical protein
MAHALAFLACLFCANGIPHFTNGVSGRDFHDPALRRLFPNVPSPVFNVAWGLLNFAVASRCLAVSDVPALPPVRSGCSPRLRLRVNRPVDLLSEESRARQRQGDGIVNVGLRSRSGVGLTLWRTPRRASCPMPTGAF